MNQRIKLTQARLGRLTCPDDKKRAFYQDEARPELLVQVTRNGHKSYYGRSWNPVKGYTEKVYLGRVHQLDLTEARNRAREIAVLADQGQEPVSVRTRLRQDITFGEAFESFLADPAKRRKRGPRREATTKDYQKRYVRHLKDRYAGRRLSSISRSDTDSLHTRLGETSGVYAANRLVTLISAVFNDARLKGWKGVNPAQGIERFAEKRRERFLDEHEVGPFIRACRVERHSGSRVIADAALLALFTGSRRSNVCAANWRDIDLDHGVWRIADTQMKNGAPHVVYLCEYVLRVLRERRRYRTSDDWVFPSVGKTGHLTEPKKGLTRIARLAKIDLEGVNMHCLKHTLLTYADDVGLPSAVRKRLAAHKASRDVTVGYTHTLERRVREAYERVAQHMLRFATEDSPQDSSDESVERPKDESVNA